MQGQLGRGWVAQDIQHGAVPVDGFLQALQIVLRSRAVEDDLGLDLGETGPHVRIDVEEAAQIEAALQFHRDAVEWNAKGVGIQAIGNLLAGAERDQDVFYRIGGRVGAA